MKSEDIEEIKKYVSAMADFKKKQEQIIMGIERRFSSIYEFRKRAVNISSIAKQIITNFDLAKKEEMAKEAIELKRYILQNFEPIIRDELQLLSEDSSLLYGEERYIRAQHAVFARNYIWLRKMMAIEGAEKTEVARKLKDELAELKRNIEKENKRITINEYLIEITKRSEALVNEIKDVVLDELEVLDKFIFREKYIPNKQELLDNVHRLSEQTDKLTKLLRKEKNIVIEPIKKTLKNKENIDQEIAKSLLENKGMITLDTIKKDLRRITTKPAEVSQYTRKIKNYYDYIDPVNKGYIMDYLDRVAQVAEIKAYKQEATTDELTKLSSEKAFNQDLDEKDIPRAKRNQSSFSIAMIDIDHFKKFNDTYGHKIGDRVLGFIANVMRNPKYVRESDTPYRLHGEEFVIFYDGTDDEGAKRAAERLREAVENESYNFMQVINRDIRVEEPKDRITISIGVATYPEDGTDRETLYQAADKALYYSKKNGRNKVTAAKEYAHVVEEALQS